MRQSCWPDVLFALDRDPLTLKINSCEETMHHTTPSGPSGPVSEMTLSRTMLLGLLVIFSEINWMFLLAFRNWEISRLRKRLNQELFSLGMAEAASAGLDLDQLQPQTDIFNEKDLALKQISFLSDEIRHLTRQLGVERQEYVNRRARNWGLS